MKSINRLPRLLAFLIPVIVFLAAASSTPLSGKDLARALRYGGYVILMRHASSPNAPPVSSANPDNVRHERQLDEGGRSSARAMGDALRRLRIPIGRALSSPTYRALETLRLARIPSFKTYSELGDGGQSMVGDTTGSRGAWLRRQVAVAPDQHTNTIIVTQLPNISEAFPDEAKGLEAGEALIFRPDNQGRAQLVARVKVNEWGRLSIP